DSQSVLHHRTRSRDEKKRKPVEHGTGCLGSRGHNNSSVLWNVVHCELVSVCEEEDGDLRVDCHVEPRANQINSYEFSVSTGTVETVVNTNVSGSSPDVRYRDHSYVEQLEPYGYRLTLNADTHTHTLTNTHTTFICKISKNIASIIIEKMTCCRVQLTGCWSRAGCWVYCCLSGACPPNDRHTYKHTSHKNIC
uniref:Immunoglobulin subtype domain-containing protein n=1 Tax=Oncorhynchus tshawytscha TaxID=74940 RepID=A0AAZ3SF45_ONCTS